MSGSRSSRYRSSSSRLRSSPAGWTSTDMRLLLQCVTRPGPVRPPCGRHTTVRALLPGIRAGRLAAGYTQLQVTVLVVLVVLVQLHAQLVLPLEQLVLVE